MNQRDIITLDTELRYNNQVNQNKLKVIVHGYFIYQEHFYTKTTMVDLVQSAYLQGQLNKKVKDYNGCFLLVIIDNKTNQLTIIQDRYGTYPIFYNNDGNTIKLSSEYKKLVSSNSQLDKTSIIDYITFGHVIGNKTLVNNIKELKPHHITTYSQKGDKWAIEEVSYWHYLMKFKNANFEAKSKEFSELWSKQNSIIYQHISNEGKNVFLPITGGLDSRLLAHAFDKSGINQTNLTYGTGANNDEVETAFKVTRHLKNCSKHVLLNMNSATFKDCVNSSPPFFNLTTGHFAQKDLYYPYLNKNKLDYFIPGHSGDAMAGSHIRTRMKYWKTNDDVVEYIIKFKSSPAGAHWYANDADFAKALRHSVMNSIQEMDNPISTFMRWNFEERQRRYIMRTVIAQNWTELPLVIMPFFDHKLIDFFAELPFSFLMNQKLFKHSAKHHIFKPNHAFSRLKVNGGSIYPRISGSAYEYYKKTLAMLKINKYNFGIFDTNIDFDDYINLNSLPNDITKQWLSKQFYHSNGRLFYNLTQFCDEFKKNSKKLRIN